MTVWPSQMTNARNGWGSAAFVLLAGTFVLVLLPSRLLLDDVLWRLPREQKYFVIGIAAACALSIAATMLGGAGTLAGRARHAVVATAVAFGALGLWIVLARGFHARPLLAAELVLTTMFCLGVALASRRLVVWFTATTAVASLAVFAWATSSRDFAGSGASGPQHQEATIDTSLYSLKADIYKRSFCVETRPACLAPRFGGGLTVFGDGYLIADGDGNLHVVQRPAAPAPLRTQKLAYRAPFDAAEFTAKYLQGGGQLFRVTDVLVQQRGELWDILLSHHYWHKDRGCFTLRVSRLTGTRPQIVDPKGTLAWRQVFETSPCLPILEPLPGSVHKGRVFAGDESGGRMALVGADKILLTVGDHLFNGFDRTEAVAQDPAGHYGKTLLVDLASGSAEVYTLGHRNPQGLTIAADGTIWLTEHGPRGGDELNRIVRGRNYGWPHVTYGTDYGREVWPPNKRQGDHDGFERSVHAWVPSIAVSSLIELDSRLFGAWAGDLLVGSYSKNLYRVRIRDGRVAFAEPIDLRAVGSGRVRDLAVDPSGRIVLWLDGGTLAFLSPKAAPAGAPPASDGAAALFAARCGSCHTLDGGSASTSGPALAGIVGRPVAGAPGYVYSDALKALGGAWTDTRLDQFLKDPQRLAPGTSMAFPGIADAGERKALVEFLRGAQPKPR